MNLSRLDIASFFTEISWHERHEPHDTDMFMVRNVIVIICIINSTLWRTLQNVLQTQKCVLIRLISK